MPTTRRILVVNPNSNEDVTAGLSTSLSPFRFTEGPEIECLSVAEGPFGIESDADIEAVIPLLKSLIERRADASAIVIACYADPGLALCREHSGKPIYGIQECGVLAALARVEKFGVLALSEVSIVRHARYLGQRGLLSRLAGEYPLNMSVAETASGDMTLQRLIEGGQSLRDRDGANAIVLGCAGMVKYRGPLEAEIGIPVIDPTIAAVSMAIAAVQQL